MALSASLQSMHFIFFLTSTEPRKLHETFDRFLCLLVFLLSRYFLLNLALFDLSLYFLRNLFYVLSGAQSRFHILVDIFRPLFHGWLLRWLQITSLFIWLSTNLAKFLLNDVHLIILNSNFEIIVGVVFSRRIKVD